MDKNKELLNDLNAIRKHKDFLFKRPLVNQKKFLNIVTGKERPKSNYPDLLDNLKNININDEFEGITFGEFISGKIENSDYTLQEVAKNINLPIETLYNILDEQVLPWNIPVDCLNRLCLLLNLSKKIVLKHINNTNIDENTVSTPLLNNYAARSQDGISSSTLKGALYDANLKIAIDREKEKRDRFIASFSK